MKSQVNALLHVARGICKDATLAYPELKESLSKDMDRLTLCCRDRDQAVFLLDLPHLESLLLRGLKEERLSLEGPLSRAVSSKTKVPRLFSGLWLRIFDKSSCLKHEVDVNALFFLRQLLVVGKKIEVACSDDRVKSKVGEYHDIERSLRKPSFSWECDELRLDRGSVCCSSEQQLPSRNRDHHSRDMCHSDFLSRSFSEESVESDVGLSDDISVKDRRVPFELMSVHLAQALDHRSSTDWPVGSLFHEDGAGTKSASQRATEARLLSSIQQVADTIFSRFDPFAADAFSLSVHEEGFGVGFKHGPGAVAERLKQHEKSCFPNWPHKLQGTFAWKTCGKTAGSDASRPLSHEMASRLISVPKTAKGPRLIAAEPTSHQWCQQLLLRFLFDQCRKSFGTHFIDFKDQRKSGDMVLKASLDRKLATVDLSDASDRLTCWTVERIFRSHCGLLEALHAARTRHIRDNISSVPSFLLLRKFASQGTATTFPVMSLVMLCIALGCTLSDKDNITWDDIMKCRTSVRVFGDDIILPSHGYERLVLAMDLLQLKVNVAKSYVTGYFRESCGTDGFRGYDITPVKPRTLDVGSPASCLAVVDTSNNLFNKGLFYASDSARSLLPEMVRNRIRVVGNSEAGFFGFTSFCGSDERHLVKRWNNRLHRTDVRVWTIRDQTKKPKRGGFDALLDFFARAHSPINPRVVGEYVNRRRAISRLVWEPQNYDSYLANDSSRRKPNNPHQLGLFGKWRKRNFPHT